MIEVPDGITITLEKNIITVKGPNGSVQRAISPTAVVKLDGNKLTVTAKKNLAGTVEAIIRNMIHGVSKGFEKKMKVLYAHFPISIEVKGKDVFIKNFLGEKQPRHTRIVGDTKVEVKGQNITISGPDKEAVGQTAANLKNTLRIKDKDPRVFQDGIYYVGE